MFLLFGYISITLLQLYRQYCRRSRYCQVMLRALRHGSVLIQSGKHAQHGSVGALLNSPLLSCSRSYKETQLLSEDGLAISLVNPKQWVDIGEWTSYLDIQPGQDANNSVIVLLEAGRPDDLGTFAQAAIQMPQAQQVHVLQHGWPVAWKSGNPYGIILHCSYRNFILLCDAFGQGRLTLDENLVLYRLLTVSAVGRPQSLKRKGQEAGQTMRVSQPQNDVLRARLSIDAVKGSVIEEEKDAKEKQISLENNPQRTSPAKMKTDKEHNVINVVGAERVLSPLTVDCSDGVQLVNNCDHGHGGTLQAGGKMTQKNGSTGKGDGLAKGDHIGFDVKQEAEIIKQTHSQREEPNQLPPAARDNGHREGILNGEHLSSKANSLKLGKDADVNGSAPVTRSDRADSAGESSAQKKKKPKVSKPPNVLVYCGVKDSARKFSNIKSCLEQCLNTDTYILYHLAHEQVTSTPWADNSAVLIISCDKLYEDVEKKFSEYLLSGGKVISFGSSMETEFLDRKEVQKRQDVIKFDFGKWRDVSSIQGCHHYMRGSLKKGDSSMEAVVVDQKSGEPLVVLLTLSAAFGKGYAIFSQLFLEHDPAELAVDSHMFSRLKQSNSDRLEVMQHLLSLLDLDTSPAPVCHLTPCYLLAYDQTLKNSLLDSLAGRMKQGVIKSCNLSLHFLQEASAAPAATTDILPVITTGTQEKNGSSEQLQFFDPEVYWKHLSTSVLGQVVFYSDVIPTTMTVFEGLQFSIPEKVGVIAIAGRQTSGKGRGGNAWLSPVGCAMFTLLISVPVDSVLGQRITFLQHIVSLAVVHSIRSLPGYQDLELCLKWPNDIYYRDQMKLGGVLVTSTIMGNKVHATVGCGVNVANSHPTICINDVINHHNTETCSNLGLLSPSQVVAMTVSSIEHLISQFEDKGARKFCELYYKFWLHSGVCVKLESEGEEVEICGLDDYGFLQVTTKQGKKLSVQPDGNTFDMMHNLIALKKR